jgi:cyclic lactone autoinducer peptide
MKNKILKAVSYTLATLGIVAAGASSVGCLLIFWDEPEMPNCMIEE